MIKPNVGDMYRKDGVTICVHHVDDEWVYFGARQGEVTDLRRVTRAIWDRDIAGAEPIGDEEEGK